MPDAFDALSDWLLTGDGMTECVNCGKPIPKPRRWCSESCWWWEDGRGGEDDDEDVEDAQ